MWISRHKLLVMASGIGFAIMILVFVAVLPIYQNAARLMGKIEDKTTELNGLTDKVSLLSKLDLNILSDRVNVLDSALPSRKDVLLYLASIDGLSKELGLSFGGLLLSPGEINEASGSAKKTAKDIGVQSLETEIKMRGSEQGVYTFLRSIERVLPLMQIKDIKVSILGGDQYALTLTLGMLWAPTVTVDVKGPVTLFGVEEEKYFAQLSEYRKFEPTMTAETDQTNAKSDLFSQEEVILLP